MPAVSAEGLTFKTDTTNLQVNGYLDIKFGVRDLLILFNVSFSFNFIHLPTMAKSKFEESPLTYCIYLTFLLTLNIFFATELKNFLCISLINFYFLILNAQFYSCPGKLLKLIFFGEFNNANRWNIPKEQQGI